MDQDIPLPSGLPAAAPISAQCRVSLVPAVDDCVESMGIQASANREVLSPLD
jgi:hypothetical protein